MGHRRLLRIALLLHGIALAVLLSGGLSGFFSAWVLANIALVGVDIALINLIMDFAPPGQKGAYVTVSRLVSIPVTSTATLLGGILLDIFGSQRVFLAALIVPLAALALTCCFPEPRHTRLPDMVSMPSLPTAPPAV